MDVVAALAEDTEGMAAIEVKEQQIEFRVLRILIILHPDNKKNRKSNIVRKMEVAIAVNPVSVKIPGMPQIIQRKFNKARDAGMDADRVIEGRRTNNSITTVLCRNCVLPEEPEVVFRVKPFLLSSGFILFSASLTCNPTSY